MSTPKSMKVALVLAAGLSLSACSTTATPEVASAPVVTETPEPTPVETEPAVVIYETGQVINCQVINWEERASDVARSLPEDQRGYELADGTFVIVGVNDPLPDAVVAQEQAAAAARAENPRGNNSLAEAESGLRVQGSPNTQEDFSDTSTAHGRAMAARTRAGASPLFDDYAAWLGAAGGGPVRDCGVANHRAPRRAAVVIRALG